MTITFIIPGVPQGKARPRFTKNGHTYTPQKTVDYENHIKAEYLSQVGNYRFKDNEPLRMGIIALYPIPKSVSESRKTKMINGNIMPTVKPDLDNIAKAVADSLNGIAYKDDAQIIKLTITKHYAEKPNVKVIISLESGDKI